jgi:nitroreductase
MLILAELSLIGATVQNLLLAVHGIGYSACWMNEPVIADIPSTLEGRFSKTSQLSMLSKDSMRHTIF